MGYKINAVVTFLVVTIQHKKILKRNLKALIFFVSIINKKTCCLSLHSLDFSICSGNVTVQPTITEDTSVRQTLGP